MKSYTIVTDRNPYFRSRLLHDADVRRFITRDHEQEHKDLVMLQMFQTERRRRYREHQDGFAPRNTR